MGNSFTTTPAADPVAVTLPTYVTTLVEAVDIATALPASEVAEFLAATDAQQIAALAAASEDIDSAMKYQGCKYGNSDGTVQTLEFPRAGERRLSIVDGSCPLPTADYPLSAALIWDWDATTSTAVVPEAVKRATVLQANSRISGKRDARLNARHDGVASQGGGGLQEAYDASTPAVLCRRAHEIMSRYRLRSGELV